MDLAKKTKLISFKTIYILDSVVTVKVWYRKIKVVIILHVDVNINFVICVELNGLAMIINVELHQPTYLLQEERNLNPIIIIIM
jgi:hypothetical protein